MIDEAAATRPRGRLPEWARKGDPLSPKAHGLRTLLREQALNTVCEEARCPNLGECFSRGTATFMILGDLCTRRCGYCSIATAKPLPPDPGEPFRVAEAAARLDLLHVVVTAVARDDLQDGGASHWSRTVHEVRRALPRAGIEVLTPDFRGDRDALATVLGADPDVFNHNLETVPRLFPEVRAQGSYRLSLELLEWVKTFRPAQVTKSGLMVGLGETDQEIREALADLRRARVDIVTLGQYLQPTRAHLPVARYVTPAGFEDLAREARALGFPTVYSGVFVRSSFNAHEVAARHALGARAPRRTLAG